MPTLKIALIGAGSESFGRGTVRDIMLSAPLRDGRVELVLMDLDRARLEAAVGYAQQVNLALHAHLGVRGTTDLAEAVRGAAFVVAAVERERWKYWAMDFHVPREFGFAQPYGENGGLGGIFHALRNMEPMLQIAQTMEKLCPEAWLLSFTNPEHKLCEALTRLTKIRTVGLCHGVFGGQHQIAQILGRPVESLDMRACGINHFTWFQWIRDRKTGKDLYPELRRREHQAHPLTHWHELGLGRILLRRFGLWPSPGANHYGEYIRWANEFVVDQMQYYYDPVDGHPWTAAAGAAKPLAGPDFVYTAESARTDRDWAPPEPPARRRPKPAKAAESALRPEDIKASGELAVPIMEGLACGVRRDLAAVNVPNGDTIPNLPEDLVVEVPAVADRHGLCALPCEPLPEGIAALIRTQASIHKLLVEAYVQRSKDLLLQAILLEPTVDSYRRAVAMMERLLVLQKDLLPRFR